MLSATGLITASTALWVTSQCAVSQIFISAAPSSPMFDCCYFTTVSPGLLWTKWTGLTKLIFELFDQYHEVWCAQKKAIGKPVASTLHRLPSQMKWECTANRVVHIWDEDGKSRQPAVEPCVVHTVPYTAESLLPPAHLPPRINKNHRSYIEMSQKLRLGLFFQSCL